jgi:hypothetical protein
MNEGRELRSLLALKGVQRGFAVMVLATVNLDHLHEALISAKLQMVLMLSLMRLQVTWTCLCHLRA